MKNLTEKDVLFEVDNFWVCKEESNYTVYRCGLTHSVSDSSYDLTEDGLSLAMCRCKYLAKKELKSEIN